MALTDNKTNNRFSGSYGTQYTQPVNTIKQQQVRTAVPAWQQYQQGNKQAATAVLKELQPTIDSALKRYAADDPAYVTQARLLALDAVKTYDPSKKAALSTHVFNNLQRLQRISAQRGNLVKVPENAALQRRVIDRARDSFIADNGIEPTTEELADMTGMPMDRIHKLSQYVGVTSESRTMDDKGDSLYAKQTKALELYDRYIYDELDRTDKKIYEWSTGYGGAPIINRAEMAKRLGISQAAVSQRASRIESKFNQDREMVRRAMYE